MMRIVNVDRLDIRIVDYFENEALIFPYLSEETVSLTHNYSATGQRNVTSIHNISNVSVYVYVCVCVRSVRTDVTK
jgi:hypothetical protein